MTVEALYREIRTMLQKAGIPDSGYEAGVLLEELTGQQRFSSAELAAEQSARLLALAQRRAAHEPLQYLLGRWPFMGMELAVGPGVLIPRADTECVCEAALAAIHATEAPQVMDLCSGTGALALGIAQARPDAKVTAVELYSPAFAYLQRNLCDFLASYTNPPTAVQADALVYCQTLNHETFDLIVCNPPYVTAAEYAALAPELHHEPETALVAGEEGLAFYRAIARGYLTVLKPGGALVFEIGASQGEAVRSILEGNGYTSLAVLPDLAGLDRVVTGLRQVNSVDG